jgi:hypothetical protein
LYSEYKTQRDEKERLQRKIESIESSKINLLGGADKITNPKESRAQKIATAEVIFLKDFIARNHLWTACADEWRKYSRKNNLVAD